MLDPQVWGPKTWFFLHSLTLAYPDQPSLQDQENYAQFFNSLPRILPCDKCRVHLAQNLKTYPLTPEILQSKKKLVHWLIDLHNEVNRWQKKKIWSYEEVLAKYHEAYFGASRSTGESGSLTSSTSSPLILTTWHLAMVVTLLLLLGILLKGVFRSASD